MRIILLHGLDTNPSEKWYPWFANEMRQRNVQCEVPTLPGDSDPQLSDWLAEIDKLKPDEDTVLVGHSRGGVALLRWLEMQPKPRKVKKVILLATNAGFIQKMPFPDESNHGFYTKEGYDFAKIKQHCDDFVVFHSKDDQWVPHEHGRENAEGLNARLINSERYGHFGKDTKEIPELVSEVCRHVPYFAQPDQTHCFQAVLKMILKHCLPERDFSWQELDDITAKAPDMWTWPTASILWLRDKGFDVHVAEDFDYVAFAEKGEQYLIETFGKEVAAEQVKHSNMQQEVALARKFIEAAKPVRHIPELQEIKQRLDEGYLVTCVVNSRKLNEQPGYTGHFILITGYDTGGFFAHDPDATANRFISFEGFQAAWADPNEKARNYIAIKMEST